MNVDDIAAQRHNLLRYGCYSEADALAMADSLAGQISEKLNLVKGNDISDARDYFLTNPTGKPMVLRDCRPHPSKRGYIPEITIAVMCSDGQDAFKHVTINANKGFGQLIPEVKKTIEQLSATARFHHLLNYYFLPRN